MLPTAAPKNWLQSCVVVVFLILPPVLVFAQVRNFDFVYDDFPVVVLNPQLESGFTQETLSWAFTTELAGDWHPLTWLSLMLDATVFGRQFHLTNLVLHLINVMLLYAVLYRSTRACWKSAAVAALFAIHPLHVETVAWVSERKGLLSTLFGLLSLAAYVEYTFRRNKKFYLASFIAFVASLMSKQMLVTLPFVLLLWDYWPLQRFKESTRRLVLEKTPFFAAAVASSVLVVLVERKSGSMSMIDVSLTSRVLNAFVAYALYLVDTIWPSKLAVLYPHPGENVSRWAAGASACAIAALTGWFFAQRRNRPYLIVGWLWYLGTLVPVIGLVQVGLQQRADRYTYVPLVGVFIALCWVVPSILPTGLRRRVISPLAVILLFVVLSIVAWRQTGFWKNRVTLWEHTVAVTQDNAMAQSNLAVALAQENRHAIAIEHFREALRIDPGRSATHFDLGQSLLYLGRAEEAIEHIEKGLAVNPDFPPAHYNMGTALMHLGRADEALRQYQLAMQTDPNYVDARIGIGNVRYFQKRYDEAIREYDAALMINPKSIHAHNNLGNALVKLQKYAAAREHYQAALRIDPNFTPAREGLIYLWKINPAP